MNLIPSTPFRIRAWRWIRSRVLGLHNEPTEAELRYARIGRIATITLYTRQQAQTERPTL